MYNRVFLLIIDSVGIGAMEDAALYGDEGADTLGNIARESGGLRLPTMQAMGLGNIADIQGVSPIDTPRGYHTKMAEKSVGKDTMTGHWELMGLEVKEPFQTFTESGFPDELIDELSRRTGRNIVGNIAASGTDIIEQYGEHQLNTGDLIVYTSADSVLQIAAHEEAVGLEKLYEACEIARELTMQEHFKVGRVIARPFTGAGKGRFTRTANRHDYALKPFAKTALDHLKGAGLSVIAFGKINDIFDGEGITESYTHSSNAEGMKNITAFADTDFKGLAFLNLVDFDALYGHRRDVSGYKKALEAFDTQLHVLLEKMRPDDLLMITADHGNDPTHIGTDHTREYVPLLVYNANVKGGALPVRKSFSDVAATICDNFDIDFKTHGVSFLLCLRRP